PSYNWNTGATSPNITINQHGKYWLRVTDANNCSASDTVVVWWPVSTEIISGIDATIKLFPNPVKDKLNILIESEKAYSYTIEVMNPQGMVIRKLKTLPANNISDTIDTEDFTPGMYLVKVSTEKGSAVFKIIVTNS
ncbi:MAG TPA: T9SS type A sorting domain-containing protein, partial [Tenuifilaceae bacterium]|nr:T9SS type A sorting domain-containing protein [Tenuifilaceae bacterium]